MFRLTQLLDEGAEAGLDDLPFESCPYAFGSIEREVWIEGWNCACAGVSAPSEVRRDTDWPARGDRSCPPPSPSGASARPLIQKQEFACK